MLISGTTRTPIAWSIRKLQYRQSISIVDIITQECKDLMNWDWFHFVALHFGYLWQKLHRNSMNHCGTRTILLWQNRPIPLCTSQISQSMIDRLEIYRKCSPIVLHDLLKFSGIYHLLNRNGTMVHMEILPQIGVLVYSIKWPHLWST
jgi:hypothetical protein